MDVKEEKIIVLTFSEEEMKILYRDFVTCIRPTKTMQKLVSMLETEIGIDLR